MNSQSISVAFGQQEQRSLDLYTLTSMEGPNTLLSPDEYDALRAEVCNSAEAGDTFKFYTEVLDDGSIILKRIDRLSPLRHPRIA